MADLPDPRSDRTKQHTLLDLLILARCATRGGANGCADLERFGKAKLDFFRPFLERPNGIPAHDTLGRVFARLDPVALASGIPKWRAAFRDARDRARVAIDGQTRRGSFDPAAGQNPLQRVSAGASAARRVLGQVAGAAHSKAITAIPLLLELLDRKGGIVTMDAMGCQKEMAEAIRDQEADSVRTVQGNQATRSEDIATDCIDCLDRDFAGVSQRRSKTVDHNQGRHETRHDTVRAVPEAIRARHAWRDGHRIGMVDAERQVGDEEVEVETRCFISSRAPNGKAFARAVRRRWGIENRWPGSLEVTVAEDPCRVRKDHGPANLGMLGRRALSIVQQATSSKDSLRGKRRSAGWDEERLRKLLTGFCGK